MGSVISKAANGIGGVVGNVFAAPFRTLLGASCEDVCVGPWDVICFIEHLCVSNLLKLLMILLLCYLTLLFFYLLFKVGICQCIGRSLCKMCWATCESYWFGLEYITCFLWHKLKNTKRRRRSRRRRRQRRFIDIEKGYTSTSNDYSNESSVVSIGNSLRAREREGRKVQSRNNSPYISLSLSSRSNKYKRGRPHVRLKTRSSRREMSAVPVRGGGSQRHTHRHSNKNNGRMLKRRRLR